MWFVPKKAVGITRPRELFDDAVEIFAESWCIKTCGSHRFIRQCGDLAIPDVFLQEDAGRFAAKEFFDAPSVQIDLQPGFFDLLHDLGNIRKPEEDVELAQSQQYCGAVTLSWSVSTAITGDSPRLPRRLDILPGR